MKIIICCSLCGKELQFVKPGDEFFCGEYGEFSVAVEKRVAG